MSRWIPATRCLSRAGLVMAGLVVLGACGGGGGGSGGGGATGPSRSIAKAPAPNGDAQSDTVRAVLSDSLRVLVTEDGVAKGGVTVTWASPSGGVVSPTSSLTDASGFAATRWTLGQTSGTQTATAIAAGATGSPVTFSATANAGAPVGLVKVLGDSQFAQTNGPPAMSPTVKVRDQFGNGVGGVVVKWAVAGGSLTLSDSLSQTTSGGLASIPVAGGAAVGSAVLRATSAAVPGALQDFSLTVYGTIAAAGVGNEFFRSVRNSSQNPAVDTIQVGGLMRWDLLAGGHTVQSLATPNFANSGLLVAGVPYQVFFPTAGTFQYDCGIHGLSMTGTVVVVP